MSRPQPPARPGAPQRPGAPKAPVTGASQISRKGPTDEELQAMRNLPAFEDSGTVADVDPENAAAGRIQNETVTITGAKFFIQDWKRKDGSFPENAVPELHLRILLSREGDEEGDKAYTQDFKYGSVSVFAPSKDGRFVNVRKAVIKEGVPPPVARKNAPAVRFLKSIKDAGGKNVIDAMKKDGADALKGLKIHVRSQKTADMHELAKPILLVDYIDGVTAQVKNETVNPNPASQQEVKADTQVQAKTQSQTAVAAAAAPAVSSGVEELAEAALLDILGQAEGNSISRAQIPTTLIRFEQWKTHEQRGAILKTLRDDAFINREGAAWKVSGNTVSL